MICARQHIGRGLRPAWDTDGLMTKNSVNNLYSGRQPSGRQALHTLPRAIAENLILTKSLIGRVSFPRFVCILLPGPLKITVVALSVRRQCAEQIANSVAALLTLSFYQLSLYLFVSCLYVIVYLSHKWYVLTYFLLFSLFYVDMLVMCKMYVYWFFFTEYVLF